MTVARLCKTASSVLVLVDTEHDTTQIIRTAYFQKVGGICESQARVLTLPAPQVWRLSVILSSHPTSSKMSSWQKKVLCRYFMVGACQAGSTCPYSHDRNISNKGTLPCRFFQAGTCANGNNCR